MKIFHNVEAAHIYIKVDVPPLKIGRASLPDGNFRMQLFQAAPDPFADPFALLAVPDIKQIQVALLFLPVQNHNGPSDDLPVPDSFAGNGPFGIQGLVNISLREHQLPFRQADG